MSSVAARMQCKAFSYTPASVTAHLTVLCENRNQSDLHSGISKQPQNVTLANTLCVNEHTTS